MESIMKLHNWQSCVSHYSNTTLRDVRLIKTKYSRGLYHMYGVRGHLFFQAIKPLTITTLQEKRNGSWHDWMVDDPPHYFAMQAYGKAASGRVLVGGLGLGMLVIELIKNPKVSEIVVIEMNPNIIELIVPLLPKCDKLKIVQDDFYKFAFKENNRSKFDFIIVDIWVTNGADETMQVACTEVLPLAIKLRDWYPNASLTFHGFMWLSDIKITQPENEVTVHD